MYATGSVASQASCVLYFCVTCPICMPQGPLCHVHYTLCVTYPICSPFMTYAICMPQCPLCHKLFVHYTLCVTYPICMPQGPLFCTMFFLSQSRYVTVESSCLNKNLFMIVQIKIHYKVNENITSQSSLSAVLGLWLGWRFLCVTVSICHSGELYLPRIKVRVTAGSLSWHTEHAA